ncbi:MAG: sigma-54-dependent Fis family transcriptional regulator [Pseudomonadota bacterium]
MNPRRPQALPESPDETAEMEFDLARDLMKKRDHEQAFRELSLAAGKLRRFLAVGGADRSRLFSAMVLDLSNLSFAVGRGMQVLSSYLDDAVRLSEKFGDERSHALACLHLGRLLAYFGKQAEALVMLTAGKEKVERLGDADILNAAAEFLGLYFLVKGDFRETNIFFEKVEYNFSRSEDPRPLYPMILWMRGLTLFVAGEAPRAFGFLENYRRSALEMGWSAVASIAGALLGFWLAAARKKEDALFHLRAALEESSRSKNAYSLFIARAGLSLQTYHDGDLEKAYNILRSALEEGEKARSAPQILISFHLMDMLAAFRDRGLPPAAAGWEFKERLELYRQDLNLSLRGIVLRLEAQEKIRAGRAAETAMADLIAARDCLRTTGAAFLLNDVHIAMARLLLREGRREEALALAQTAWRGIRSMGLAPELLPDDLQALLDQAAPDAFARDSALEFMDRYFEFLHELDAAEDETDLFHRCVSRSSRLLGAERGALFWVPDDQNEKTLEFRTGFNFSKRELESPAFRPSLALAREAFRKNRNIGTKPEYRADAAIDRKIIDLLCLPIEVGRRVKGVLYCDNAFVSLNFDFIPAEITPLLVRHAARYFRRVLECLKLREERSRLAADKSSRLESLGSEPFLTQSRVMFKVLGQAEKAARSEATLLVTGETGTGKELLVARLHKISRRSAGSFIVVDSTAIPENLVESELFGHEKGAFTGADSRRRGRIELAHEGTLFIDEIGELPLGAQAKLLRALENKTFYRVGGTQPVKSDFRLMAATNRRLPDEVAAGRFRQDLYYRLNVIPLTLPPLRDRGDDVILLARHFFRHFCQKYNRPRLELTRRDEEKLTAYPWPGNLRELKNVIERAVILSAGDRLALDIPLGAAGPERRTDLDLLTMDELQRQHIIRVLEKTGGRIDGPRGAAAILGLKRSTLYSRMYKLGLRSWKNK